MCGVAGIVNITTQEPIASEAVHEMIYAISHRGPDEVGYYMDESIGLGHARLNIIDLKTGSQPIANEDQSLWIIFNGEIFNYRELRQSLQHRGHIFSTTTDTEVILHLYEELGDKCVHQLNGQFAFAIWDRSRKRLFIARDRVGIRPLHYTQQGGRFYFASEIKSLFTLPEISRQLDLEGLKQVFTFWSTLPGKTVYRNIYSLPAGYTLTLEKGEVHLCKYWDFSFDSNEPHASQSVQEISEVIIETLKDATRIRLHADVPVGMYVSGGLDSSGIAVLAKKQLHANLKTFGLTFENHLFDESVYQNQAVAFLESCHTAVAIKSNRLFSYFPDMIRHSETPLLRMAPIPMFLLSRVVHEEDFKVVLSGEGADEVFGGYNLFRETKARRFLARNPQEEFRNLPFRNLYTYIFHDSKLDRFKQDFFAYKLNQTDHPFYSHLLRWDQTSQIQSFFTEDTKKATATYDPYEDVRAMVPPEFGEWDYLARAQYLEMKIFMSQYLLSSQGDRPAMAHSVEIRMPFLDHRIIEYMGTIPSRWKILGMEEKFILKKAFRPFLPHSICSRSKFPFRAPTPVGELFQGSQTPYPQLEKNSLEEAGVFHPKKVECFLKRVQSLPELSERDKITFLGILSTQMIHEQFIKGKEILESVSYMEPVSMTGV